MNILFIPILAVLIGYFVRSRLSAVVLFLAIESIFFTFQTLAVFLAWMAEDGGFGGATDQGAFGPTPSGLPLKFNDLDLWLYGLVNFALIAIGVALTIAVVSFRIRRRRKLDD
ncbi:MAG: hypothetical protein Q4F10_06350 [Corynebacterium glutamicum]|nr:hypothetical protein [Corynebacterium glutamicum]